MEDIKQANIKWKKEGISFVITDNENDISIMYKKDAYIFNSIDVWITETGTYIGRYIFNYFSNTYEWDIKSGIY